MRTSFRKRVVVGSEDWRRWRRWARLDIEVRDEEVRESMRTDLGDAITPLGIGCDV